MQRYETPAKLPPWNADAWRAMHSRQRIYLKVGADETYAIRKAGGVFDEESGRWYVDELNPDALARWERW